VILAIVALSVLAAVPPPPAHYVTDIAGVIPDDRQAALEEKLAGFERATTNQLIVYVDRKIPSGTTIEELGAEAIRTWGVGQKKSDNGAILFLFIDDRQSRIEVGYGLEHRLTDARSKTILVGMRDALRAGRYADAIDDGATRMIAVIRPEKPRLPPEPATHASGAESLATIALVVVCGGIALVLLLAFIAFLRTPPEERRADETPGEGGSGSSNRSYGSSSSSSPSSSHSSPGFTGGGGSGGGGGASDRW
jgi:uncharacterized protein